MTGSSLRSSRIGGVFKQSILAALVFGVALVLAPEDPRAQATIVSGITRLMSAGSGNALSRLKPKSRIALWSVRLVGLGPFQ